MLLNGHRSRLSHSYCLIRNYNLEVTTAPSESPRVATFARTTGIQVRLLPHRSGTMQLPDAGTPGKGANGLRSGRVIGR